MKLFPTPNLEPGESIRESWVANRTQSQSRAVGGRLYLTTHKLAFVPHVFDAALAGQSCSIPLTHITSVGLQPGEFSFAHLFDGGLRTRLRVETDSGSNELFVVQRPDALQRTISDVLTSTPNSRNA